MGGIDDLGQGNEGGGGREDPGGYRRACAVPAERQRPGDHAGRQKRPGDEIGGQGRRRLQQSGQGRRNRGGAGEGAPEPRASGAQQHEAQHRAADAGRAQSALVEMEARQQGLFLGEARSDVHADPGQEQEGRDEGAGEDQGQRAAKRRNDGEGLALEGAPEADGQQGRGADQHQPAGPWRIGRHGSAQEIGIDRVRRRRGLCRSLGRTHGG